MQKCFHLSLFFWRIQTPDWELGLQPHLTELLLTKSQNHRLNEVGRALGSHLVQLHAQAGPPTASYPESSPESFWKSLRRTVHQLSAWSMPMHCHPHSTDVLPGVPVCACGLMSCHWAPLKRAWTHLLNTCPLEGWVRSPPDLLQAELQISQPLTFAHGRCFMSLAAFLAVCWNLSEISLFFLNWEVQAWTQYSIYGLTRTVYRGRRTSLYLLAARLFQIHLGYPWPSGV